MSTRRAALYARISVSTERSISVDRQLAEARAKAESRGWTVVAEFYDDGVSASKNAPEKRKGWRDLQRSADLYDVVVVWKLDRLIRSNVHFWETYRWLTENNKLLVLAEGDLDMTTAMGRTMAGTMAGFAEIEAEAISARVANSRKHLLKAGRATGGKVLYGWRNVPNPDGPGLVRAQDPEQIEWVRQIAERARKGQTIYSICRWLDAAGAPRPGRSKSHWNYNTVESILRNPVLAGMTPYNPGNPGGMAWMRNGDVLRNELGLPVVDATTAIMQPEEWRALCKMLDDRDSAQSMPRAMKSDSSPLLSGLLVCGRTDRHGSEQPRMWRGKRQGREGYVCRDCYQTITNFEGVLIDHFLEQKGDWVRWSKVTEVYEGGAAELPEVENRLLELEEMIRRAKKDERGPLQKQHSGLLDMADELRSQPGQVVERWEASDTYFSELWAAAATPEDKRAVLDDAIERIVVVEGAKGGPATPTKILARLKIEWKRPGELGPRPLAR